MGWVRLGRGISSVLRNKRVFFRFFSAARDSDRCPHDDEEEAVGAALLSGSVVPAAVRLLVLWRVRRGRASPLSPARRASPGAPLREDPREEKYENGAAASDECPVRQRPQRTIVHGKKSRHPPSTSNQRTSNQRTRYTPTRSHIARQHVPTQPLPERKDESLQLPPFC